MTWHDISTPVHPGLPVYPGDPPVVITRVATMASGDLADVTALSMCAHAGTHVDAPAHALPGAAGVEAWTLDALIGPARVVEVGAAGALDRGGLRGAGLVPGTRRVLLRTRDVGDAPPAGGAWLTEDAARLLIADGTVLVGIDTMSIASADDPMPVHRLLLAAGVVIVEGLDLRTVPAGTGTLICLPLLLPGADGAPARAVFGPA